MPSHEIRLLARRDRFGRGGDHSGFNAAGFAAIGFRESRENYSKQHNADDTLDGIDYTYLAQNASTLSYTVTITLGEGTWSYDETTMLRMTELPEPLAHTDHNTLRRVG